MQDANDHPTDGFYKCLKTKKPWTTIYDEINTGYAEKEVTSPQFDAARQKLAIRPENLDMINRGCADLKHYRGELPQRAEEIADDLMQIFKELLAMVPAQGSHAQLRGLET